MSESITVITLLLSALDRIDLPASLIGIPMNRAAVRCLARAWSKCWSSIR
jgi:hypothetical protein